MNAGDSEAHREKKDTFTVLLHSMFRSEAANYLSMSALGLLADWLSVWLAATRNEKDSVPSVTFMWSGSKRNVSRYLFSGYRKELVAKGFIEIVNVNQGLYKGSSKWKTWTPSQEEREGYNSVELKRQSQRSATKQYRESHFGTPAGKTINTSANNLNTGTSEHSANNFGTVITPPIAPSVKELDTVQHTDVAKSIDIPQCQENQQPPVHKISSHNNTNNNNHYHSGGGGDVEHIGGGLEETLASLKRTAEEKETDPEFQKKRDAFETSIKVSTSNAATPVQQFVSEYRAAISSCENGTGEKRHAVAKVIGRFLGSGDQPSVNKIANALTDTTPATIEAITKQVLSAKGIDSRLALWLSEVSTFKKSSMECRDEA